MDNNDWFLLGLRIKLSLNSSASLFKPTKDELQKASFILGISRRSAEIAIAVYNGIADRPNYPVPPLYPIEN